MKDENIMGFVLVFGVIIIFISLFLYYESLEPYEYCTVEEGNKINDSELWDIWDNLSPEEIEWLYNHGERREYSFD